jgi:hypothetical protein
MRVQILSAFGAALLLGALPAAAHATCPCHRVVHKAVHHVKVHVVRRVVVARINCPPVEARIDHNQVIYRDESRVDFGQWREEHHDMADRDGHHRMFEEHSLHDGMHHDDGMMEWRGATHEERWSSDEHHEAWRGARVWTSASSDTDRFGFLTWPGKTHFQNGQPIVETPEAPAEGPWQVHP